MAGSAANFTWSGSVSTDWFNTNNWTPAGLPGSGDTVNVGAGTVNFTAPVTFNGQFNWTGGGLIGASLTIAPAGILSLSGSATKFLWTTLTNAGTVTWAGSGNLEVDFYSVSNEFGLIQNLAAAVWDIQSSETLLNGYPNGAYFQNAGTVRKSADTGTTMIAIPFYNTGAVTNVQGVLSFSGGGIIGGSFMPATASSDVFSAGAFSYGAPPTISGGGTVSLVGGSLALVSNTIPNLQLAGGTITLGTNFQGGTITNLTLLGSSIPSRNTVLLGSNIVSGTFSNAANLTGSLTLLSGAVVTWSGGSIQGPINIAAGAALTITGGTAKYLWGPLTNAGTVVMTNGGNLEVDYSTAINELGSIQNLPGGLWDMQSTATITQEFTNGAYFQNAGTVLDTSSGGYTTIGIPFFNSGTVTNAHETISLNGGGAIGGAFQAAAGAMIEFNNGSFFYGAPPAVTGAGMVELTGGSLTLASNTIPNLQLAGGIITLGPNFQGGTITNLTVAGGTLSGNYTVSGIFNTAAALTGSLTLLSGSAVTWSGGSIQGPVNIPPGALLTISGGGTKFLLGALTNAGTVEWTAGVLEVDSSSANNQFGLIQNLAGGLWDIQNSSRLAANTTNDTYFQNSGTLRKSADAGITSFALPLNNSGNVIALQGTLMFTGGGMLGGKLIPESGAVINFNAGAFTYNNSAPPMITGAGTVELTGGSLTLGSDTIPNLDLLAGAITLGPNFQGGTITNLTLLGGALLGTNTVSGVLNTGAALPGPLTLLNGAAATWSGGSMQGPVNIAAGAALTINGSGTKFLWGALTNTGTVTWAGAGNLEVDYSSANNQFGLIQNLSGALWDIQNSQMLFNSSPNDAYFQNAGTVRKSADTLTTTIAIPFYNSGTVITALGTLNFSGGGILDGAFTLAPGTVNNFSAGAFGYTTPPVISGGGRAELTGGSLTLINDVIPNFQLAGGTVTLGPAFQGGIITNLTLVTNPPPAKVTTLTGNMTVSGAFNTAANLTGSLSLLSGADVNWSGGSIAGPVNIAPGATLTISGSTTKFLWGALTNAGTVNLTGSGNLEVDYSSAANEYGLIQNLAGALWNIQGDQNITNIYRNDAYFENLGAVQKSAGTNSAIAIPFTNAGTLAALQGALTLNGGAWLAEGTLIAGLGSATNYGQFSIPGNAVLAGALDVNWVNGFVPALSNSFSLVTYGSHAGSFSPLTVPSQAIWRTNYGPTALTLSVGDIPALVILSGPLGTNAGATLAPLVVQVQDALTGSPIDTNGLPVTVTLAGSQGTLGGTVTRNTDATGKVTFNDLSINLAGTNTLVVSAPNTTPATNISFIITPAAPAQLALLTAMSSNQVDGTIFQPSAAVQVQDAFGNAIANATATITARSTSTGAGGLGGVISVNANGTNGVAVFTNLYYVLGNQSASESVTVSFTSPGLASVANPAVFVNFVAGLITLRNNNSVVQINPDTQQGVFSWTVDGVNLLSQEWFWLRQGSNGPQTSIDALGVPLGLSLSPSNATVEYSAGQLNIVVGFALQGGAPGSQTSAFTQSVSVQNAATASASVHLYQYADFDLSPGGSSDVISFPGADSVVQQGQGEVLTQNIQSPAPSFWEAGFYPLVLDQILSAGPATLSDTILQPSAGDQTFAYQWDAILFPGQALGVNLTQTKTAQTAQSGVNLSIVLAGPDVVISWPAGGTGVAELQSTANLSEPDGWSAVPITPVSAGQNYQVTVPLTPTAQFFRLTH